VHNEYDYIRRGTLLDTVHIDTVLALIFFSSSSFFSMKVIFDIPVHFVLYVTTLSSFVLRAVQYVTKRPFFFASRETLSVVSTHFSFADSVLRIIRNGK
jgi:hypothetical protein